MADINVKVYFGYSTILTAYTLAQKNEQRLDQVQGTANEANARSQINTTRLDSVEDKGIGGCTHAPSQRCRGCGERSQYPQPRQYEAS